jgi:hypothetical protein
LDKGKNTLQDQRHFFRLSFVKIFSFIIRQDDTEAKQEEVNKIKMRNEQLLRRSLGNIQFIGELFKSNILTVDIMNDYIEKLLRQDFNKRNLQCLCHLLTKVGRELDKPTNIIKMDAYLLKLTEIIDKKDHIKSGRIRCMILDVIELRQNKWISRQRKQMIQIRKETEENRIALMKAKVEKNRIADVEYGTDNQSNHSLIDMINDQKFGYKSVYDQQCYKTVYSDDELERQIPLLFDEYIRNFDFQKVFDQFQKVNDSRNSQYIELLILNAVKRDDNIQSSIGNLLHRAVSAKKIEIKHLTNGLKSVMKMAEEISLDEPKISTYLGQILAPMVHKDCTITFLSEACEPIKNLSICADFIKNLLNIASTIHVNCCLAT